jgi:hypothetical protein
MPPGELMQKYTAIEITFKKDVHIASALAEFCGSRLSTCCATTCFFLKPLREQYVVRHFPPSGNSLKPPLATKWTQ